MTKSSFKLTVSNVEKEGDKSLPELAFPMRPMRLCHVVQDVPVYRYVTADNDPAFNPVLSYGVHARIPVRITGTSRTVLSVRIVRAHNLRDALSVVSRLQTDGREVLGIVRHRTAGGIRHA